MPRRIQKSITIDYKKLETFERNFPSINFSQWVEDQMGKYIKTKAKGVKTPAKPKPPEEAPPTTIKPLGADPYATNDPELARARFAVLFAHKPEHERPKWVDQGMRYWKKRKDREVEA